MPWRGLTWLLGCVIAGCGAASAPSEAPLERAHAAPSEPYRAQLDDPTRDAWQQPDALIAALEITAGMRVADVGTGTGYLLPLLSRAVGPTGRVTAEDVSESMLDGARARIAREALTNVDVLRGEPSDPGLSPGSFELVLMVNTYHHLGDRPAMLGAIQRSLVPAGGRFVVVEFRDGALPVGPPPEHKVPRETVLAELSSAGFFVLREHALLPYQYVLELGIRGVSSGLAPSERTCGRGSTPCDPAARRPMIAIDPVDLTPTTDGFPAVSRDGARVVVESVEPDGGRGAPNLTLLVLDAARGEVLASLVVLEADEGSEAEERTSDALRSRVEERLLRVRDVLVRGDYRSLAQAPPGVARQEGPRVIVSQDGEQRGADFEPVARPCVDGAYVHTASLSGAWTDGRLVVLRATYEGTDLCGEPPPAWRIVQLPQGRSPGG